MGGRPMTENDKIYAGDFGHTILVDSESEVDAETEEFTLLVQKPGADESVSWTAQVENSTSVKYITVEGDLEVSGEYKIQLVITSDEGSWRGETATFIVYDEFQ